VADLSGESNSSVFDFDEIVERKGTYSIKFDFPERRGKPSGLLPLWVADMDFKSPPCVRDALERRVRHGIFGYSESGKEYFDALYAWFFGRFGWAIRPEWVVQSPGVVFALYTAVRALTDEDDAVMIQQPVYPPFTSCVLMNNRRLVVNKLVLSDGKYEINFEAFERQIAEEGVKLFILCNPHNPVGRVWREDELRRMLEICLKHGVAVVSDEIHQDFVYAPHSHIPFAGLSAAAAAITVTCTAPTKTFNLAGLSIANIIIGDGRLRERFVSEQRKTGVSQLSVMGLIACRAAYEGGEAWLDELVGYLRGNALYMSAMLERRLPKVKLIEPEGTYLAWLDCSALGLDDDKIERAVTDRARLWLDPGVKFGSGGSGFLRLNYAAPRAVIEEALGRLIPALSRGSDPH
jgi:cystathionine beta-lyase